MKHANSIFRSMLVFTSVIFFSSMAFAGGDKYSIYLNDKLVTEQYVYNQTVSLKNLQLSNANSNDNITIYYSHCGEVGTGRSIVLKDENNNVLKEWKFADGAAAMTIKAKDILDLQKKNGNAEIILVYYSNKYLPRGRSLTSVKVANKTTVYVKHAYIKRLFS